MNTSSPGVTKNQHNRFKVTLALGVLIGSYAAFLAPDADSLQGILPKFAVILGVVTNAFMSLSLSHLVSIQAVICLRWRIGPKTLDMFPRLDLAEKLTIEAVYLLVLLMNFGMLAVWGVVVYLVGKQTGFSYFCAFTVVGVFWVPPKLRSDRQRTMIDSSNRMINDIREAQ